MVSIDLERQEGNLNFNAAGYEGCLMGIKSDKNQFAQHIRELKNQVIDNLQIVAKEHGQNNLRGARRIVKEKADSLKQLSKQEKLPIGKLPFDAKYAIFYPLPPQTTKAITDIFEDRKTIRSRQRAIRNLSLWEDYFKNQPERDEEIEKQVQIFTRDIMLIKSSELLSEEEKKQRESQRLKETLAEMKKRKLAPEQILKSFLKPETYHPRKSYIEMLEIAQARSTKSNLILNGEENRKLQDTDASLAAENVYFRLKNYMEDQSEKLRRARQRIRQLEEAARKNGNLKTKTQDIINAKFRIIT